MISCKIGLGIQGGTSVPLVSPTGVAPAVVKLVDPSSEYVAEVREQVGPKCLIVVRWTRTYNLRNPVDAARDWCVDWGDKIAAIVYEQGDRVVAFEGINEPSDNLADMVCQFEKERLDILHSWGGINVVVGNFSVGKPGEEAIRKYAPMFEAMGPDDYVGWHCYTGAYRHITNPWHTHRWTLPAFAPYLKGKRIVVTECGADYVRDDNLPEDEWGAPGWKAMGLSADEYLDWLRRFGELYDADPQVVGACVFGVGGFGWHNFDVTDLWPRVVAQYAEPGPVAPGPEGRWVQKSQREHDLGDELLRITIERWEA